MSEKFTCKICQREYSSPQSLCNHTRIKHKVNCHIKNRDAINKCHEKNRDILHIFIHLNYFP
jgi:hypothetical protein